LIGVCGCGTRSRAERLEELLSEGRWDEAEQMALALTREGPEHEHEARSALVRVYAEQGRFDRAREEYERAFALGRGVSKVTLISLLEAAERGENQDSIRYAAARALKQLGEEPTYNTYTDYDYSVRVPLPPDVPVAPAVAAFSPAGGDVRFSFPQEGFTLESWAKGNVFRHVYRGREIVTFDLSPKAIPGDLRNPLAEHLAGLLTYGDPKVREDSALTLVALGHARGLPLARTILNKGDENWRRAAVETLSLSDLPGAVAALRTAGKDRALTVRLQAIRFLGEKGDSDSLPLFSHALQDGNWKVRVEAVIALGNLQIPESTTALREALKDKHEAVHIAVLASLWRLQQNPR
jgi:HEAT repeat protein